MENTKTIEALVEAVAMTKDDELEIAQGTEGVKGSFRIKMKYLFLAAKQIVGNCLNNTVPASSTRYLAIGATNILSGYDQAATYVGCAPNGMLIKKFAIRIAIAMPGNDLKVYLRVNDSTDTLVGTITSGQGPGWFIWTLPGDGLLVYQDQRLGIKVVNSYTAASAGIEGWVLYYV